MFANIGEGVDIEVTDSWQFLEDKMNISWDRICDLKSGHLDDISKKIVSLNIVVTSQDQLVMQGHSSCDQELQRSDEQVVEGVGGDVAEASLFFQPQVSVNVLGNVERGNFRVHLFFSFLLESVTSNEWW